MRFDIIFYVLGILCFIFAAFMIPLYGVTLLPVAFLIVLLLFSMLFVAFGYSTRPRHYRIIAPPKPSEVKTEEKPLEKAPETPQPPPPEPSKPRMELTKIKGIGPKRIVALNALQIMSVEDLAKFSAEELADKLKVSSKITAKWVEQARNLVREGS